MDKICPECGSPLNENGMCTNVLCDYKESSDAAQPTLQEVNLRLRRRRRQMKRIDDVIACKAELYTHLYEDIMHGSIDLDSIKKYWRGTCRGQEELEDLLLEDGYEVREGELSDSDYPTSMPQGYQFEEGDSEEEDCSQEISVSVLITEEEEQLLRERLKVLKLLADSEDEEKFV